MKKSQGGSGLVWSGQNDSTGSLSPQMRPVLFQSQPRRNNFTQDNQEMIRKASKSIWVRFPRTGICHDSCSIFVREKTRIYTSLRCNTILPRCCIDLYNLFVLMFSTRCLLMLYSFSACSILILYQFSTSCLLVFYLFLIRS